MSFRAVSFSKSTRRGALLAAFSLMGCSGKVVVAGGSGKLTVDGGLVKAQAGVDWTMLAFDHGSTYWNQAETKVSRASAPKLEKAWEFDVGQGSPVTSTPVISGGRVYFLSTAVIALNLSDGTEVWRNADITGSSSPALADGTLYVNDTAGVVRALDARDGHQLWAYTPEEPWVVGFSSPVVTKDYVLVGTAGGEELTVLNTGGPAQTRGYVLAVNRKDGTLAWKKYTVDPPSTGVGIWSTVSVDDEASVVVAGTGNNYTGVPSDTSDAFLAMHLDGSGDFLWKPQINTGDVFPGKSGSPDGDFGANPILFESGGKKLAAGGAKMGDIWVVDRADGTVLKQRNLGPPSSFKGGIFVSGAWDGNSLLFACNGATSTGAGSEDPGTGTFGALFAVDPLTLEIKWERQYNVGAWGPISVANGVGFFGKDKTLQAFNTETGEVLNEFPTEATIATAPSVSDGYVVFGSGMSWIGGPTAGTKYYALKVP
jgi:polyvinyl alcohol dehydrogenase (cytochrome)